MEKEILIVDYGMGNLGSIYTMLKHLGIAAEISSSAERIADAGKIILAGVGAFDNGMRKINGHGFTELLHKKVLQEKTPVLGICLGMQLMTQGSEEGTIPGLGWLTASTVRFQFADNPGRLKIPHMGWNIVQKNRESQLTAGLPQEARFYFVHSYHVICRQQMDVLLRTHYGYDFPSAIQKGNIFGVQFHPEKSHRFGMQILKNFAGI